MTIKSELTPDLDKASNDALKSTIRRLLRENEALREDLRVYRGERRAGVVEVCKYAGPKSLSGRVIVVSYRLDISALEQALPDRNTEIDRIAEMLKQALRDELNKLPGDSGDELQV